MDSAPLRIGSVFSGIGGFELGFDLAFAGDHGVAFYIEREAYSAAILARRMDQGYLPQAPVWSDARSFPAGRFHGLVDILLAGYPCQPFSICNKIRGTVRQGHENPKNGWPALRRIIAECRPAICFLENTEGHIRCGLQEVIAGLGALNYRVTGRLAAAMEVGAPHLRKRIFCLAISMADPDRVRMHQNRLSQAQEGRDVPYSGSGRGTPLAKPAAFPPGREDWDAWERIPARDQPALHRGADGIASGLGTNRRARLSALGNSICPLQAAHAMRALVRGEGVPLSAGGIV